MKYYFIGGLIGVGVTVILVFITLQIIKRKALKEALKNESN